MLPPFRYLVAPRNIEILSKQARARLTFTCLELSHELEHSKGLCLAAFTVLFVPCLLISNRAHQPIQLHRGPQAFYLVLPDAAIMADFWPPAPTAEGYDGVKMPSTSEEFDCTPSLEEATLLQRPTTPSTSTRTPSESSPTSLTATMPGCWPSAPAVEDCDELSPVLDSYDATPVLEEPMAQQQPTPSDTSANAPGVASPGHAHSYISPSSPPQLTPFPFPHILANTGFGAAGHVGQASQVSLPLLPPGFLAQIFGPFTGSDDEDEKDDSENEDGQMPSLEAALPLGAPASSAPNPSFPPNPYPHPNALAAALASFPQSIAVFNSNSQATPSGASQEPTESQNVNEALPTAAPPTGSGNNQGGSANVQNIPFPSSVPGSVTISMGTLSGGPNGPHFTAATGPVPTSPQTQEFFNNFFTTMQHALADISANDIDLSNPFPDFIGPLPPLSTLFNMGHPAFAPGPPFDATAFVDSLEQVNIAHIPDEDMRCPHCWLPFGTTDEDDPDFVFAPDRDESPTNAERQVAFHELPFCTARPDNDPVQTLCGHIFGRGCLIETMERVNTRCPTCRQELLTRAEGLSGAV
ncbi:hypothetical protein DE146DRAFT_317877 [Phaeosphaeria sp. MPI-PUGE-AT-0046c]|nr:hypothetical protein DE146DRAFT_317877 [Phaeosphaeria sp. MPI-PUGE-AT-0046c]